MELLERPKCRINIVKNKLSPNVVDGVWDSYSCITTDLKFCHLSEGMRRQMKKMILEGYWGEGIGVSRGIDISEKYYVNRKRLEPAKLGPSEQSIG